MTSILKRKRGAVEVKDTIKRAKSTKNNGKDVVRTIKENIWEKALENTTEGKELVKVNVEESLTNGHTIEPEKSDSADVDAKENELVEDPKAQGEAAAGKSAEKASLWKLSESIGGRMSNLEPVFTADEKLVKLLT
jgi:NET1-associated nuclear protein 1 (U3 small nucleolar RNA-associated protein 17)